MIDVENYLDKKLQSDSNINIDEFFDSKINNKLTLNQQEAQLDKTKTIMQLNEKWRNRLEKIYKEKGLYMDFNGFNSLPVFTLENLEGMREQVKNDDMKIILIQGVPSSGKSTVALPLLALALDDTFTHDRIGFSREDVERILNYILRNVTKFRGKGLVFVFDEGTEAFFSGDSGSKSLKDIFKILTKIREANPMIIINSTSAKKIHKDIRDEFVNCTIRTPKKGEVEFYNKRKMNRFKFPKDGDVIRPKPNFKENTPKITGPWWEEYRRYKHRFLSDEKKTISNYKEAVSILGMIPNWIEKLILLFYFEGFRFKEMSSLKKKDYKAITGYLNGRTLKPETREVLNEFLTFSKDNRKKLIFPNMKIKDLENIFIKIKNEFE